MIDSDKVIKTLENCIFDCGYEFSCEVDSEKCPYSWKNRNDNDEPCIYGLISDVRDLIKEQKAEIEKLKRNDLDEG